MLVLYTGGPGCGVQVVSAGYLGQGGPDVCTEGPGHVGQSVCVEDRVQGGDPMDPCLDLGHGVLEVCVEDPVYVGLWVSDHWGWGVSA